MAFGLASLIDDGSFAAPREPSKPAAAAVQIRHLPTRAALFVHLGREVRPPLVPAMESATACNTRAPGEFVTFGPDCITCPICARLAFEWERHNVPLP